MNARAVVVTICSLCLLGAAADRAWAAAPGGAQLHERSACGPMSMDQAVKMAEQRYRARVVKAETEKNGGRTVYVLRLYSKPAGKVWTVHVDAANGSIS
jgi:uncharacterized membrane protein YkoI